MAKSKADIVRVRKLQFKAGQAKPGPALAGVGINMPDFTRAFNDATRDRGDEPVPVQITVYKDKSFDFKVFTAPASYKLIKAAKLSKGSSNAKTTKIATITVEQLREIAEYKLPDLNTNNIEAAMRTIAGTAKNMGILIEGFDSEGDK
ncbi:50S ribosomal protein L11 [Mycoplasmopsis phocirhinis]|uniref:Large ribosomal subunit protein uL11 n=1 Tax=Mycoplasmopsis phocirhinis TaxID=142650 RepID=A0A4P6MQN2_9BACT|nr:50S ribosomal protein L11 [Mycoplasmopsis phocirhinis]QBF34379.1 50S ribosomal protein L11 [Mycoplasmopsis phocirhinis]